MPEDILDANTVGQIAELFQALLSLELSKVTSYTGQNIFPGRVSSIEAQCITNNDTWKMFKIVLEYFPMLN